MTAQRALGGDVLYFVKASMDPLLVVDDKGIVQFGNIAVMSLLRLDLGNVAGEPIHRFLRFPHDLATASLATLDKLSVVGLCGDDSQLPLEMVLTSLSVNGRFFSVARLSPITTAMQAATGWSLDRLFELSADMLCVLDSSGCFAWVNPASELILGYPPTELLNNNLLDWVHPEDITHTRDVFSTLLAGDRSCYHQHRFRTANDTYRWLSWNMVRGDDALYCVGRDVTERKRAESELRLASRIIDDSQDGIMILDARRKIRRVNRAFTRLTGFTDVDISARNIGALDGGRQDAAFYRDLWRSVRESGGWQGEIWGRKKGGDAFPLWLSVSAINDASGQPNCYVGIFADISEKKRNEEHIQRLAHYDAVTGLPNRVLFQERLERAVIQAQRSRTGLAVMFIDLDRFKAINDSLGHSVGDQLLAVVGQRLSRTVRNDDTVSRRGGDEFTVILTGLQNDDSALRSSSVVADKMLQSMSQPFLLDTYEAFVSASIGISLYPQDANDVGELIKNADAAMYHAKKQGRNNFQFYSGDMNARAKQRLTLESRLRMALERDELKLVYQPQVDLTSGAIIGVEALLRWMHPELGVLSPTHFMQLAEDTGLVLPIGDWVLEQACKQHRLWEQAGCNVRKVSVNLSPRQFAQNGLVQRVAKVIREYNMPSGTLELEILESTFMDSNSSQSLMSVCELSEMGVCIAIDDFGIGYSSLSYLKRFPLQVLKIDQSFVRDIATDVNDAAIIKAVISMAQSLEIDVIAEGIETPEQLKFLLDQGCGYGQGFYFGRPMAPDDLARNILQASSPKNSHGPIFI